MTVVIMMLALLTGTVLQVLLPGYAWFGHAKWPLLTAITLYYALQHGTTTAIVVAVVAGLIQDALSPVPLGYSCCCLAVVAGVVSSSREYVLGESVVAQSLIGGAAAAVTTLVTYLLLLQARAVGLGAADAGVRIIASAGLGMVCTPLVFLLIGGTERLTGSSRQTMDVEGELLEPGDFI